jgi:hypothetical protein
MKIAAVHPGNYLCPSSLHKVPIRPWYVFSLILWNKGVTFSTIEMMDDVSHAWVQSPHVHHISAPTHVGGTTHNSGNCWRSCQPALQLLLLSTLQSCPKLWHVKEGVGSPALHYGDNHIYIKCWFMLSSNQKPFSCREAFLAEGLQPMFSAFCRNG